MTSSSEIRNYPPSLYEEGKSPLQNKSMNHNCFRANFAIIKDALGDDSWSELRDSSVGVFIKFAEMKYVWAAQRVHYFLTHQLAIQNSHEIWLLFGGRPIRFSLNEFADITGLNYDHFPENDDFDVDHKDFWAELGLSLSKGPMYRELDKLVSRCTTWSRPKKIMVGRLVVLSVGVYSISHGSRIPLLSAKRVLNSNAFENYPWGRVAFDCLIRSIKVVEYNKDSYCIHGCVQVLLAWICESVPGLGEGYGNKIETTYVLLLRWESFSTRVNFQTFIEEEKAAHKEVRVRHMIPLSVENMYPVWSDDSEQHAKPELDKLIIDIINGRLRLNFSDGLQAATNGKKKRKEQATKKEAATRSPKKLKKKVSEEDDAEGFKEDRLMMAGIFKLMEKMSEIMETKFKDLNSRMDALDEKLKSYDILENDLKAMQVKVAAAERRLNLVENDVKDRKVRFSVGPPNEAEKSNPKVDDEAESNSPSWILEPMETSQEGLPSQRVVRNKKKNVATTMNHVVVKKIKQSKTDNTTEETWSDPAANLANAAIDKALTVLEEKIKNLDAGPSKSRRIPQLSKSQKFSYVGNSTIKRIMKTVNGVVPSPVYDAFKLVEAEKLKTLTDFLNSGARSR